MTKSQKTLAAIAFIGIVLILIGVCYGIYRSENEQLTQEDQTIDPETWKIYHNTEYGFMLTLPDSWKGYTVVKDVWKGGRIDESLQQEEYTGPKIILKNPQTTAQQMWQDIPIMVFTHDVWQLVAEEKLAVSAAPIGPTKIGENADYVFATPPRWYGFTDTQGWEEAVEIVKTFRAVNK